MPNKLVVDITCPWIYSQQTLSVNAEALFSSQGPTLSQWGKVMCALNYILGILCGEYSPIASTWSTGFVYWATDYGRMKLVNIVLSVRHNKNRHIRGWWGIWGHSGPQLGTASSVHRLVMVFEEFKGHFWAEKALFAKIQGYVYIFA